MDRFLHMLFPNRCAYCGHVIRADAPACEKCLRELPRIEPPLCLTCGVELAYCTCKKKYHFKRCVAPFYYEGRAKSGIRRFKFQGHSGAASVLGREMAEAAAREYGEKIADVAVCVPMSRAARRERGYNQAALLAKTVAEHFRIPFCEDALVKQIENEPQHNVGQRERWGNVLGVFGVNDAEAVRGKWVLLVDDIMTTGATLNECARVLREAGATQVYCLVCAVTRSKKVVKAAKVLYNTTIDVPH